MLLFFRAYGKYFLVKYAIIQCFVASRLRNEVFAEGEKSDILNYTQ
jgi:hypothetical protein